jgi:Chromo (CHRromatin Organisation MOdifier) domain
LPSKIQIHPTINVERIRRYYGAPVDPPTIEVAGEPEWEVEKILAKRYRYNKPQYLIKWRGYPAENNSWEPKENLGNASSLLQVFEE